MNLLDVTVGTEASPRSPGPHRSRESVSETVRRRGAIWGIASGGDDDTAGWRVGLEGVTAVAWMMGAALVDVLAAVIYSALRWIPSCGGAGSGRGR